MPTRKLFKGLARVVPLNKPGKNAHIPVYIFNISAKAMHTPAKAVLCELHKVKGLRSVDPFLANCDSTHVSNQTPSTKFDLQDIWVSLDNSRLISEQKKNHDYLCGATFDVHTDNNLLTFTEQKKKLNTYLFSHMSANTYSRNIIFISNKSVFNFQQTCVNETQMQCNVFEQECR